MAERDIIMVRQKEVKLLHVLHKVIEGEITQGRAAQIISLSGPTDTAASKAYSGRRGRQAYSIALVAGKLTGRSPKSSRRGLSSCSSRNTKDLGLLWRQKNSWQLDAIQISDETLRLWLLDAGEWQKKRKRKPPRQWRPRKEHCGEMLQLDGSQHKWFEDRGPECVLMAYIDGINRQGVREVLRV